MKKDSIPQQSVITRDPISGSRKIYVKGQLHNIEVAMREITLHPTKLTNGKTEQNASVTVYDTSGPYTDSNLQLDVKDGLPRLREQWIIDRNDTVQLTSISSEYGKERLADTSLDGLRFNHRAEPRKAAPGKNVTQLHYARKGIITPEMEYIAIRENQRLDTLRSQLNGQYDMLTKQHAGESFGANTPKNLIT